MAVDAGTLDTNSQKALTPDPGGSSCIAWAQKLFSAFPGEHCHFWDSQLKDPEAQRQVSEILVQYGSCNSSYVLSLQGNNIVWVNHPTGPDQFRTRIHCKGVMTYEKHKDCWRKQWGRRPKYLLCTKLMEKATFMTYMHESFWRTLMEESFRYFTDLLVIWDRVWLICFDPLIWGEYICCMIWSWLSENMIWKSSWGQRDCSWEQSRCSKGPSRSSQNDIQSYERQKWSQDWVCLLTRMMIPLRRRQQLLSPGNIARHSTDVAGTIIWRSQIYRADNLQDSLVTMTQLRSSSSIHCS